MNTHKSDSIGQYLIKRLYEEGVEHVFGIPGDYVLGFYNLLVHSPIQHIGTTREDTAAFAADGYARCRGLGALAVTYGVGALNTINAIAGAYAESSPVIVISGAPGVIEQREDPLIHHRFGPFTFQREIFERVTCMTVVLDDPVTALRQIDRALAAAKFYSKPVYIEIPRDLVLIEGFPTPMVDDIASVSDPSALYDAVAETLALLAKCVSPMLIAGVELHRRRLQHTLVQLVEHACLPVVATLSGKSVFNERHPAYLGIYEGAMSSEFIRYSVEQSDLLLMLGVTLNDVDTGIFTARLDPHKMIRVAHNEVVIGSHRYPRITTADYLFSLVSSVKSRQETFLKIATLPVAKAFPQCNTPMTIDRLIARLNQALSAKMMVVCDVGDCLFAALELRVHEDCEFLASSFYASMGFAVPAALGAQIARPGYRALILVGDGGFQMTGTELSTHIRAGLAPIVVVLNNRGYSTERSILEGSFNDISLWRFDRLGELFGPLQGYDATTEESFENALKQALDNVTSPSLINVHLEINDKSLAMQRLAEHLKSRIAGSSPAE